MSNHSHTPSSGSHGSIFSEPHAWFSTSHPEKSNLLDATVKVGHNVVDATVGTVVKYVKDILNPTWAAVKNVGSLASPSAYREHGLKTLPKAVSGIVSNTATAAMNIVTGIPRGIDHAYTRGVTDSLVDVTSGTTDRVPLVGKFGGNILKAANSIIAAPVRFLGRVLPEHMFDNLTDWWNSAAVVKPPARHLTTKASSGDHGHSGGGHGHH